jgi:hypothetical protein
VREIAGPDPCAKISLLIGEKRALIAGEAIYG